MSKERRKLEAVSKGAVNLLDSTAAVGGGHDSHRHSGTVAHDKAAQVRCCSDEAAVGGESEAKEAEGVVSGFVPNPTVMLVRLATSGVVVPVIRVRAYLFRRGMAVRVYRAFDGWRLK